MGRRSLRKLFCDEDLAFNPCQPLTRCLLQGTCKQFSWTREGWWLVDSLPEIRTLAKRTYILELHRFVKKVANVEQ